MRSVKLKKRREKMKGSKNKSMIRSKSLIKILEDISLANKIGGKKKRKKGNSVRRNCCIRRSPITNLILIIGLRDLDE